MSDFFKFPSDKSYVHEITYLVDAEYYLSRHPQDNTNTLINNILNNKWYNSTGQNVSNEVYNLINKKNMSNHNVIKLINNVEDKLSN